MADVVAEIAVVEILDDADIANVVVEIAVLEKEDNADESNVFRCKVFAKVTYPIESVFDASVDNATA